MKMAPVVGTWIEQTLQGQGRVWGASRCLSPNCGSTGSDILHTKPLQPQENTHSLWGSSPIRFWPIFYHHMVNGLYYGKETFITDQKMHGSSLPWNQNPSWSSRFWMAWHPVTEPDPQHLIQNKQQLACSPWWISLQWFCGHHDHRIQDCFSNARNPSDSPEIHQTPLHLHLILCLPASILFILSHLLVVRGRIIQNAECQGIVKGTRVNENLVQCHQREEKNDKWDWNRRTCPHVLIVPVLWKIPGSKTTRTNY